jgi:hypothetical protein
LAKCEKIPANIKETICNQCDEDFLRNLQQPIRSKVSIWEHYHISEDEGIYQYINKSFDDKQVNVDSIFD